MLQRYSQYGWTSSCTLTGLWQQSMHAHFTLRHDDFLEQSSLEWAAPGMYFGILDSLCNLQGNHLINMTLLKDH